MENNVNNQKSKSKVSYFFADFNFQSIVDGCFSFLLLFI